jgi:hypothetical protein
MSSKFESANRIHITRYVSQKWRQLFGNRAFHLTHSALMCLDDVLNKYNKYAVHTVINKAMKNLAYESTVTIWEEKNPQRKTFIVKTVYFERSRNQVNYP